MKDNKTTLEKDGSCDYENCEAESCFNCPIYKDLCRDEGLADYESAIEDAYAEVD